MGKAPKSTILRVRVTLDLALDLKRLGGPDYVRAALSAAVEADLAARGDIPTAVKNKRALERAEQALAGDPVMAVSAAESDELGLTIGREDAEAFPGKSPRRPAEDRKRRKRRPPSLTWGWHAGQTVESHLRLNTPVSQRLLHAAWALAPDGSDADVFVRLARDEALNARANVRARINTMIDAYEYKLGQFRVWRAREAELAAEGGRDAN